MIKSYITRTDINTSTYTSMLELVSKYKSKPTERLLSTILLNPTLFIHMMFKLDGQPLKLYPYQDLIIRDNHRYIIFRAANQIGKSLLLDAKAGRNILIDHGKAHNEAIVSKSLPQSIFQMRRVKSLLNSMDKVNWKEERGTADSMSVISVDIKDIKGKIKYTNLLICAPCTEGLLGYDLHELNLDEFEYWDTDIKHFFNQIAQPRTYSTKGGITIFSNPNGMDSFVSELELQTTLDGKLKWHTYIFSYLDKPGNTQAEYDQLKHELPRHSFESTVAAIRSISDRNWFTPDEIERSYDHKVKELDMIGKQPFFFLDVGAKHDQSVLVGGYVEIEEVGEGNRVLKEIYIPILKVYPVGYPISRVVGSYDASQDSDGWQIEKSVKEILTEWSKDGIQPIFGCDVTGNSGISPLFQSVGINPIDVTFSGPVKSGMYQRFKYYMEKGLLHRVKSKEWDYQARHLEVKKSMRGYLMIHHENEDDLDDCMDATAGLIYLADNPNNGPVSLTVVDIGGDINERGRFPIPERY